MAQNDDYYALLGISKGCSDDEVKKGYKKMALKWHPDRNPNNIQEATEMFKNISEAYEVLNDTEKRKIYDQHGKKGLAQNGQNGGGGFSHMNAQSIFEEMMRGGGGPFGNMGFNIFQQQRDEGPKKGPNVTFDLQVTLKDLYLGCTKKVKVHRDVICHKCQGTSIKSSSSITDIKCSECKGQGSKMVIQQLGPGFISQHQMPCNKCKGTGEYIPDSDRCEECKGNKVLKTETIIDINVEKGMKEGTKIVFQEKSDEYPGRTPGDIIVSVREKNPFEGFKRTPDGEHLIYRKKISLQEALCGYEFIIEHFDGRKLHINCNNDIITPDSRRKIKGEGMPLKNTSSNPPTSNAPPTTEKGDLFIEFEVEFPDPRSLTTKDKQKLKQFLPGPLGLSEKSTASCTKYTPTVV
jgi:DnaJ family protein A protein 2